MSTAWKFLAPGQLAPFGGLRWPGPGPQSPAPWVRPPSGEVFACRLVDLPWWLDAELWEVELEGPVSTLESQLVAPAGRLIRRIEAWDAAALRDYGAACALRARKLAVGVLHQEGREEEAEALARPDALPELARVARSLSAEASTRRGANLAGYVADSATRAAQGAGAAAANIAANAAVVARQQPSAFDLEREWQARWIARRTGLPQH
jgi:hypothetical protein